MIIANNTGITNSTNGFELVMNFFMVWFDCDVWFWWYKWTANNLTTKNI